MAKYSINDTTLKAIADPLRSLLGLTGGMTPEEMAANGQAVQTNVTAALAAIENKGVMVPAGSSSDDLEGLILEISQAEDLDAVLDEQESKIEELLLAIDLKAAGDGAVIETWQLTLTDGTVIEKRVVVA
jgi:hypothetical protein